jgi:outer membrane protein assembly factor BamD (BamD/ComL family)
MSVSGISPSHFFASFNPTAAQSKFKQIQQDFQQLGQDLQSGSLSQAQSEFSALQQLLPGQQAQSATATSTTTAASGSQSTNPISQAVAQLGSDLQSGNLSAAQSDFNTLQQDLQQPGGVSSHRFHHHHGGPILEDSQGGQNSPATLLGELGQELQSGNLTAAQQTYSNLQQDFQQFIGGNGSASSSSASASTAANSSLNVSA